MEHTPIKDRKLYAVILDMLLLNPKYRSSRKKKRFNAKQKLFVLLLDVIVLAELFGSMYRAQQFGDSMTPVFLKTYLPVVVVTLIIGKLCINRLGHEESGIGSPGVEHSA